MKPYLVDLLKHKNVIEENLDHKNPHKEQPKEINLLYPILNMDFTVQFESVHTEIIKNTFQRPEFHSNLLNGIIDLLNRSKYEEKIFLTSSFLDLYENYISIIAKESLRFLLKDFSENSLSLIHKEITYQLVGLMLGLESCSSNIGLHEQVCMSYLCPERVISQINESVNEFRNLRGITLRRYLMFTSPWASSIADELFVFQTYEELQDLIGHDKNLYKIIKFFILVSLSSTTTSFLSPNETVCMKRIQNKYSWMLHNHLLRSNNNASALEKHGKFVEMVGKLKMCGEIVMRRSFDFGVESLEEIQLYPL